MSSRRTSSASDAFSEDGYVVLPDVVGDQLASDLLAICLSTLERKHKARTWLPMQQHRRQPMSDVHKIVREAVGPVIEPILGARLRVKECWIRSAPPDGRTQSIHRDGTFLGADEGPSPDQISTDLLLTDYSAENGGTEIWPGSHLVPDRSIEDVKRTAERAAEHRSSTITAPKGSLVIRDPRAWHRVQINRTDAPRVMVSIIFERDMKSDHPTSDRMRRPSHADHDHRTAS